MSSFTTQSENSNIHLNCSVFCCCFFFTWTEYISSLQFLVRIRCIYSWVYNCLKYLHYVVSCIGCFCVMSRFFFILVVLVMIMQGQISWHFQQEGCQPGFLIKREVLGHYVPAFVNFTHENDKFFNKNKGAVNLLHPLDPPLVHVCISSSPAYHCTCSPLN